MANNPNSHSSASASFSGRLFASVMDYPFACVVLLVLITAFAVGGYLNPSWPQQLLRKWNGTPEPTLQEKLTGSTNTSTTSNPGASTATTASRDAARGRRGFGGRGGGGRGGMGRGGGGRGDAILVVQSPAIFTPEGSEAFRAVLQRVESLDVVASVRSLDQAPPLNIFGLSEPILPKANSTQQRFDAAKKKAVSHPLVVGQMLSPDAKFYSN